MAPLDTHHRYFAFVDPSGGSADSFTLAIRHRDGERFIIDAIREEKPPFSPTTVIEDFAALLKTYPVRVWSVIGMPVNFRANYSASRHSLRRREKAKSDLFRDLLPLLNSGRIVLPNPTA